MRYRLGIPLFSFVFLKYGMPSSHAFSALSLSSILLYLLVTTHYPQLLKMGVYYVAWYTLSISVSRVYLGVHSVLDVIGGLVFGAMFSIGYMALGDAYDHVFLTCIRLFLWYFFLNYFFFFKFLDLVFLLRWFFLAFILQRERTILHIKMLFWR